MFYLILSAAVLKKNLLERRLEAIQPSHPFSQAS